MPRSHTVPATVLLAFALICTRPIHSAAAPQALPSQPYPPAFEGQTRAPAPPQRSAYEVETLATGLVQPWALAFMPDGRMLVTERPGRLRVVEPDGRLSAPIDGVPAVRDVRGRGMAGLALDPAFVRGEAAALHAARRTDLRARGLLDTTLVLWHGEFGRLPISQRGVGRDHNPGTMTVWMAGAGIDGGQVIGASDEFGYKALEQPISAHDLHATILHLLGMDHTKLTYRFNGRDMRLTDVEGTLIPQITST